MSLPEYEYESQAKSAPNYGWIVLIVGSWIVLSTVTLFITSEFYSHKTFEDTFLLVAVASGFGYIFLFARHGLITIPLIMLSGILQCGGCVNFIGYRSGLSGPVRAVCCGNLHSIGLALETYHQAHGTFPPAFIANQQGQPLYGWTVPILPYIEQQDLYRELHLDEPWNSPHNKRITDASMPVLQCPVRKPYLYKENNHIGYLAVVGPETAWPGTVGRPLSEFTDGPANTILLFEVAALDIPWAAPPTLTIDQAIERFTKRDPHGPSTRHEPANISVLLADGTTRSLPNTISPAMLRAMLTVNGGEQVIFPEPFPESSIP